MKYREWPLTIGSLTSFITSYVLCLRVLKLCLSAEIEFKSTGMMF